MDQHSTQSVYIAQTSQPQPPSVGYNHNNINNNNNFSVNNNNGIYQLNDDNNNNNHNFDNSLHFDSTQLIDDGLNWSAFGDNVINPNVAITRFQSIGNDITGFDQQVFNQNNDDNVYIGDNNTFPPSINHNSNNNHNNRNRFIFDDNPINTNNGNGNNNNNHHHGPIISDITDTPQDINLNEMDELRRRNELLLQQVAAQQRQIEFLAQEIGTMRSQTPYPTSSAMDIGQYDDYNNNNNNNQYDQFQEFDEYQHQQQRRRNIMHQRRRNPLKRRRISSEALLPPAA